MLELSDAQYTVDRDGYPFISLLVNGLQGHIDPYSTKLTILDMWEAVSLGGPDADILPPITIPAAQTPWVHPHVLVGFTRDPRILASIEM